MGHLLYGENNIPEGVQGNVKQITAGRSHFTVLLNDGTVRSWGQNNNRQSNAQKLSNIVSVHSNYFQNYAIDSNGKFTWGLKGLFNGVQTNTDVTSSCVC